MVNTTSGDVSYASKAALMRPSRELERREQPADMALSREMPMRRRRRRLLHDVTPRFELMLLMFRRPQR